MKIAIRVWLIVFALIYGGSPAQGGTLEQACDLAYKQLGTVPHLNLTKSTGNFSDNTHSYEGCIVRLKGDREKIKDAHYPASLFYPSEGTTLYRQGWRADQEADGPEGTSFRISKQNVFCMVEGSWDGGDDSDHQYIPSTRYEVIVSCGIKKQ